MEAGRARAIARNWFKDRLDDGSEMDVKRLARIAEAELRNDPEFREAFFDDFLYATLYEVGLRVLAHNRAMLRTTSGLRRQLEQDIIDQGTTWDKWLECDPGSGASVRLLSMTREQVMAAASYRQERAESEAHEARWLQLIARKLRPGQQVGDVLSGDDLQQLRDSLTSNVRKVA